MLPIARAAAKAVGSATVRGVPALPAKAGARYLPEGPPRWPFEAIKAGPGDFPVGLTLALVEHQAVPGGEARRDRVRREVDDVFLDVARADDFVGVQTYSRTRYGADGPLPPEEGVEVTMMGYEFWPEALEATIRYAAGYTGQARHRDRKRPRRRPTTPAGSSTSAGRCSACIAACRTASM